MLIPRFHGDYEIPPIEFSYFDVTKNKYKILNHPGFNIKVSKGTNQSLSKSSVPNSNTINEQEDVELINENIHHIKSKTKLYDYSDPMFWSKLYWSIIFSIPIGLIFLLIILSNKNRFTDKEKIKVKKIIKKVNQEFNNLNNNIDQISVTDFYKEISKLWNIYLTNKYQIKLSDLSRDKIKEILKEKVIILKKIC